MGRTDSPWSGVPVLLQAFRSLGVPQSVKRNVPIKQRDRGLDEASYVESFVILNAVGGECLDDLEALKQDGALQELIGHAIPSPEAAPPARDSSTGCSQGARLPFRKNALLAGNFCISQRRPSS